MMIPTRSSTSKLHQIEWFKGQGMLPEDVDGGAMIDKRYAVPLGG